MEQVITPYTLGQLVLVGNPLFSPDGTMLAYTVGRIDIQKNRSLGDLCILRDGIHHMLSSDGSTGDAQWTDDNRLLFCSSAGDFSSDFSYIDPSSGAISPAFSIPYPRVSLAGCCDNAFFLTIPHIRPSDNRMGDCLVFDEVPFWRNGAGITNGRRLVLYRYRLTEGLQQITPADEDATFQDAADGQILYTSIRYQRGIADGCEGLYLKKRDGSTITLCPPERGLHIYFAHFFAGRILFVANKNLGDYEYPRYYTVSLDGGDITLLYETDSSFGSNVNSDVRLNRRHIARVHGDKVYFTTTRGGNGYLVSLSSSGDLSQPLTPEGCCDTFDLSPSGELIYCGFYGNKLAELYSADGRQLTNSSDCLAGLPLSSPLSCGFLASDGFDIDGWVMPPVHYEKGKQYPAIFHIHGGPRTAFGSIFFLEMQVWAAAGYFVCYCNPRGSDGKGTRFANLMGTYGTVDYQNFMEFTDHVLSVYTDIDPRRIGVTGGSYGGFLTNWIIGHTDRFKAAVSQRSIGNYISSEYLSDVGYEFNITQHGITARENPAALWDLSPLKYAVHAVTPTLFIQSEEDYRCYFPEALQMYTCLRSCGCEARVCLFKGENHELSRSGKPQNRIRRMEEIVDWMDRYLQPTAL